MGALGFGRRYIGYNPIILQRRYGLRYTARSAGAELSGNVLLQQPKAAQAEHPVSKAALLASQLPWRSFLQMTLC